MNKMDQEIIVQPYEDEFRSLKQFLRMLVPLNFILTLIVTLITLLTIPEYANQVERFIIDITMDYILLFIVSVCLATITLGLGLLTRGLYMQLKKVIFRYAIDVQISLIAIVSLSLLNLVSRNEINIFSSFEAILIGICLFYIAMDEHTHNLKRNAKTITILVYYTIYGALIPLFFFTLDKYPVAFNPYSLTTRGAFIFAIWWFSGLILGLLVMTLVLVGRKIDVKTKWEKIFQIT